MKMYILSEHSAHFHIFKYAPVCQYVLFVFNIFIEKIAVFIKTTNYQDFSSAHFTGVWNAYVYS